LSRADPGAPADQIQWAPKVSLVSREAQVSLSDYIEGIRRNRERSLVLLREAVRVLNEDLADLDREQNGEPAPSAAPKPAELVTLKPGIWGMSFDLKEAWRRAM
jgi:hypothetical protein